MHRALLPAAAALTLAWHVEIAQAACDEDTIDTISDDGDLIVLSSGSEYDVDPSDQSTAAEWQEGDDVLVCQDTLIDKDQNGERVSITDH